MFAKQPIFFITHSCFGRVIVDRGLLRRYGPRAAVVHSCSTARGSPRTRRGRGNDAARPGPRAWFTSLILRIAHKHDDFVTFNYIPHVLINNIARYLSLRLVAGRRRICETTAAGGERRPATRYYCPSSNIKYYSNI